MNNQGTGTLAPQITGAERADEYAAVATPPQGAELEQLIVEALDDDKAQDVVVIPLAEKSSVTDAMIIASGRSPRHVGAIADHLIKRLKDAGVRGVQVEGATTCDWVLIDVGDAVVHIFRPEVRTFYDLEKMWATAGPEPASA